MQVEAFDRGVVRGFLHVPQDDVAAALVLTHGAGANCNSPLLIAVANAFCHAGFRVLRCDLPFRQRRPFGPPFPQSASEDRAALKAAAAMMRDSGATRIFLGGHSYGGRQASILASEEPHVSESLLLLSYPLHPPKKPAELRTAHFGKLGVPALFVHGTKDPFGSIEEMSAALRGILAPTKLITINNAGHDLSRGKFDVEKLVVQPFQKLMNR